MKEAALTDDDLARAARHGIKVHRNRLILEAQPPATADDLARIESRLCGPVPDALRALWSVSFGGRLRYDLRVRFDGFHASGSCEELFYPGSDHYNDLDRWIDTDLEIAERAASERGKPWSGKLDALPFAGFEYLERYYVVVDPQAQDCGAVLCWRAGTPIPDLQISNPCLGTVASSLDEFLNGLTVEHDPRAGDAEFGQGVDMMEVLDDVCASDPSFSPIAEKLEGLYLSALLRWRDKAADGTLTDDWAATAVAIEHALEKDDVTLLRQIAALETDLNAGLHGGFSPLRYAFIKSAFACAEYLVDCGVDVTSVSVVPSASPQSLKDAISARR